MGRISGKDTKPELIIRKILFSEGYRYRIHRKDLPGNPDIVFPSRKKVIFVNGCFWHGHNCKRATLPKTNKSFWQKKLSGNKERDKNNLQRLKTLGWNSLVVWQCQIKKSNLEPLINKIKKYLDNL